MSGSCCKTNPSVGRIKVVPAKKLNGNGNSNGHCRIHSRTAVAKRVAFVASTHGEIADTSRLDLGWCFG